MSIFRFGSISAIGTFTDVNGAADDYLSCDPQRCVAAPTLRTTVEDKPGQAGVMVFPALRGGTILTVSGPLMIRSDGSESGYYAAIDTLYGSLDAALAAMEAAPDDVVHSGGTTSCALYAPLVPTWEDVVLVATFGLVVVA